jgi:hypothetical protein
MKSRLQAGLSALMLLLPSTSFGQQPTKAQADAVRQLCRTDYQTHCAGIQPGGSAALACLEQNAASLSPPCQQAVAAIAPASPPGPATAPRSEATTGRAAAFTKREEMAQLRRSCGPDYRQFCSDVEPGRGRGIACLIAHRPQLSKLCSTALASAHHAR